MTHFYDYIDKIIYINLDYRVDRQREMTNHFNKYNIPKDKIIRLSATKNEKGNIGVYDSHIRALQYAIDNKLENILICEDDFEFNYPIDELNEIFASFNKLFKNQWDVFQLVWGPSKETKKIKKTNFYKCICGGCAVAYIVNKKFYEKMMKNFKEGYFKLVMTNGATYGKTECSPYNIDMYWCKLQRETMFWITYLPSIGKVRPSYSDIRHSVMSWDDYLVK